MAGLLRHSRCRIHRSGRRQRHQAGIEEASARRGCHSDQRWRLGERARPRRRRRWARLGWAKRFHYVRMGPGKGIAFGSWENAPVFCLPGGPLSNEMAFLQFALPALVAHGRRREAPASDCACPVGRRREEPASGMDGIQGCRRSPLMKKGSMPWRSTEAGAESRRSPGPAGSSAFRRARSGCVAARSYPCNCSQGLDDGCPPSGEDDGTRAAGLSGNRPCSAGPPPARSPGFSRGSDRRWRARSPGRVLRA